MNDGLDGLVGARLGEAYQLFNVAADPGETRNLAAEEPSRAEELKRGLHAWRRSVGAQEMSLNPAYDPSLPTELAPPAERSS